MAFLQGLWLLSGTTWFDSLRIRDAGPRHSPLPRRLLITYRDLPPQLCRV
jgi:hypothetical protein